MKFFSKRRFNWIDVFANATAYALLIDGNWPAALVVFFAGAFASVVSERKWGT